MKDTHSCSNYQSDDAIGRVVLTSLSKHLEGFNMSIKAVIFDLDETLVEKSLNNAETLHKILEQKKIHVSVKEVEQAYYEVKRELGNTFEEQCGKIPRSEYHYLWNFHILKVLEIEDSKKDISREVTNRWIGICGIKAHSGARSVLTALKHRGLKAGIISGLYEEEIQNILEIAELNKIFFDVIVGTDTVKRKKPDPEVFKHALKQLEIEPEEAVYVGDDLEKDYRAAERVGMNPLLLVKSDDTAPENVRKIKRLISLIDYLGCNKNAYSRQPVVEAHYEPNIF